MNIPRLLTITGLMVSPLVFSAGFQVNEQSVSSLARANAGRGAVGDNAADIAQNPAISSVFGRQQITLTASYVDPNVNVKGTDMPGSNETNPNHDGKVPANANDIAQSELVPGFYYVLPYDDRFSFGLSVNTFYGMGTKYPLDFGASEFAGHTSIRSIYVTPSMAYKINEAFAVGVGFSYVHGTGKINNTASPTFSAVTGVPVDTKLIDIKGGGSEFGWNVGGLWQINDHSRLGLSYRSETDIKANVDVAAIGRTTPGKKAKGRMTLNLPRVAEIGYFNQLNETFALALGVQYTDWKVFKQLTVDIFSGPNAIMPGDYTFKEENWKSSFRYSIGGDYRLNKSVVLHAGYAYDQSSVPGKNLTLTIPDNNRNWYTFGATLNFEEAGIIDLAFAYIKGDHSKLTETLYVEQPGGVVTPATTFDGKFTKLDALIFSIGYSYKF